MDLNLIPASIRNKYHFDERGHATAILSHDFPQEFKDIGDCLDAFVLKRSEIVARGGAKSRISKTIDNFLRAQNWREKSFNIEIRIDGNPIPIPTHKIDDFKNKVGIEVEWNNKTEFYDRDLNNFRLLHDLHVLSVGVIITRLTELQQVFNALKKGKSYGASTTHWDKLIPKIDGGGAGGCPLLLVGMGRACYNATL
jgi:hypothetical protein